MTSVAPAMHTLTALCRVRRVETEQARRDLGVALAQETALAARDEAMRCELETARRVLGEFDREAFSAWWERMRIERARLADAMLTAEARAAAARIVLANRRVAETAAKDALAREVTAHDLTVARREQGMLEDVARALTSAASGRGRG
jgi:hypothetical protein